MYPYLLDIGFIRISSLSVLLIISFIVAVFIIWKQGKEKLYPEGALFDTIILSVIGGFIFARIGFILLHFETFGINVLRWIAFWIFPGFYLYAGIIGVIVVLWYQSRKNKELNFWELLDFFGFAFWVSLIIAYIGIFLSGVEKGIVSSVNEIAHPVSLYKCLVLIVAMIPYLVFRVDHDKEDWFHKTSGSTGLFVLLLFSLTTLILDYFKVRETIYGLGIDQWISLIIFIVSFGTLYFRLRRTPKKDARFFARVVGSIKNIRKPSKRKERSTWKY